MWTVARFVKHLDRRDHVADPFHKSQLRAGNFFLGTPMRSLWSWKDGGVVVFVSAGFEFEKLDFDVCASWRH